MAKQSSKPKKFDRKAFLAACRDLAKASEKFMSSRHDITACDEAHAGLTEFWYTAGLDPPSWLKRRHTLREPQVNVKVLKSMVFRLWSIVQRDKSGERGYVREADTLQKVLGTTWRTKVSECVTACQAAGLTSHHIGQDGLWVGVWLPATTELAMDLDPEANDTWRLTITDKSGKVHYADTPAEWTSRSEL